MSLADWIERRAGFTPDKPAIRFAGEALSYRALAERIARYAAVLGGPLGLAPGERVAYLGLNCPELLALLFACARTGLILVPVNWRLAAPEIRAILEHAGAAALVVDGEHLETAEALGPALEGLRPVALGAAPPGWASLAELAAGVAPLAGGEEPDDDAPVLICYTSGTTGQPKGVVLGQRALLLNAVNSAHMHDLTSADRVLTTLPMFHVGGLNIQTLPALHAGATVTVHPRFDPEATLETLAGEAITLTVLVPAQIAALLASPRWAAADLGSLRMITTGSTLVPRALIDAVHARGIPLIQVYGSTETAPIATYLMAHDARRKAGSAGRAATHCAIRVVDAAGREVAAGEPGEVLVRGPALMSGYWRDPPASAAALAGGWFHSGDIGHLDDEGYLYIDDRKKDVIISGGENIYPAELENVLAECALLAEAAVVGRPDARWGEVPVVFAVRAAGAAIDEAAVRALFEGRIARYKHPREVRFVDFLPRNAMGKIQKDALRAQAAGAAAPPSPEGGSR